MSLDARAPEEVENESQSGDEAVASSQPSTPATSSLEHSPSATSVTHPVVAPLPAVKPLAPHTPTIRAIANLATDSEWDAATKRAAIIIILIVLVVVVWVSRPVLPMLIVGGLAAYLLSPIVSLFERLRIPRPITTVVLFLLILAGAIILPVILIPILIEQLGALSSFTPTSVTISILNWLNATFGDINEPIQIPILNQSIRIDEAAQQFQSNLRQILLEPSFTQALAGLQQAISTTTNIVGFATTFSANLLGGIVQVVLTSLLTFFISLYLTMDAPKIRTYVQGLFPQSYQSEIIDLLRNMSHIWQAFFRGQIILAVSIGFVTWGALTLAGMPGALVLGIFAGMMEVVPNVGPTLAMIPAIIVALIQGSTSPVFADLSNLSFALVTVGIYFIIQQLENSVIVPRVIGDSVNLHPVVVISGVVVGFSIGGVLGAFLASPIIASLRVLGGYVHAKLLDYPPFLEQEKRRRSFFYRRTVRGSQEKQTPKEEAEQPEREAEEVEHLSGTAPGAV